MAGTDHAPVLERPRPTVPPRRRRLDHLWALLRRVSVPLLRWCLGLVFVWFGALKVAGRTPVADLVAGTVPWLDAAWFVPALGAVEVILGLALIIGYRLDLVSLVLAAHLAGTFLVFVMQPGVAFHDGNPLLLSTEGEFVAKNLVLIAGALVVAAQSRRVSPPAR